VYSFNASEAAAPSRLDVFEYVYSDSGYVRARAFFLPPVTGAFTFLCSADDYMQLSATLVNGTCIDLCSLPSFATYREWDKYPSQV
jgi:hypothetical protein